jgi:MFS transporter, MHS family, shikimate and dehydroshikimate transport protein
MATLPTAGEPTPAPVERARMRRVLVSSFVGSAIEWYDFILYGTVAALVFPALFFPNSEPATAALASLSTFAVGFIARPIGGIVAGYIGDRYGRKRSLVMTLLIGGLSTFAIGFVPTYATIGLWAPILLVVLRLIQGFGVGGEWGSAVLMATEHADADNRGRAGGWAQLGVPAGLFSSTLVMIIVRACMSADAFDAWGWRLPFLLSAPLIGLGLFIRLRVSESPVFTAMAENNRRARNPLWSVLRRYPKETLLTTGLRTVDNVAFFIPCTFAVSYGKTHLGISNGAMELALVLAGAGGFVSVPLFARLSDRVGRRRLYFVGSVVCAAFAFPFFWLIDTGSAAAAVIGIFVYFNVGHSMIYGPQAAWFSELFSPEVRTSGVNLGTQLSSILSGGLSPIIAAALVSASGGSTVLVAAYTAAACLVSALCCRWTRETRWEGAAAMAGAHRSTATPATA